MGFPHRRVFSGLVVVLLITGAAACSRLTDSPPGISGQGDECWLQFHGVIRQGPSTGFVLGGDLKVPVALYGNFSVSLIREDNKPTQVSGQIEGRAVNLGIQLENAAWIFAIGTLQDKITSCTGIGGGLLTGPTPGDSGDWSVAFQGVVTPQPIANPRVSTVLAVFLVIVLLLFGGLLLWVTYPGRRKTQKSLRPAFGKVEPELWPAETVKPIAQFLTTYLYKDDLFDVSFPIEVGEDYLGECGTAIAHTLSRGSPKKVAALEVWMFDKSDTRTVNRLMMSEWVFGNAAQHEKLASKGEAVLIALGMEVVLDTDTLRLRVMVAEMAQTGTLEAPNSYFNRVTLKLAVWRK